VLRPRVCCRCSARGRPLEGTCAGTHAARDPACGVTKRAEGQPSASKKFLGGSSDGSSRGAPDPERAGMLRYSTQLLCSEWICTSYTTPLLPQGSHARTACSVAFNVLLHRADCDSTTETTILLLMRILKDAPGHWGHQLGPSTCPLTGRISHARNCQPPSKFQHPVLISATPPSQGCCKPSPSTPPPALTCSVYHS
jgi:hypothetical protein